MYLEHYTSIIKPERASSVPSLTKTELLSDLAVIKCKHGDEMV